MKKNLHITLLIAAMSMFFLTYAIADSKWSPAQGLENNMIIYGKVLVNDSMVQSDNYVIGAFDDQDVCRGKAEIKMHENDTNFYMTVLANQNGEKLFIKVMNVQTGDEYKVFDSITFQSDATIENLVLNAY